VVLESGDLFVFGGPARLAYHGVPRTLPGTGPDGIGLPSGRLNITLRESGLTAAG
jgi:alkylated DNA repair protein (DNA oxidative demethylase)